MVLVFPVFILIALIVRITFGSPVLFKQKRTGYLGKQFYLYKFRTMLELRDISGELLPDHLRTNKLSAFLRSMGLDELPGLYNVFKGDLSIVGPRPLLPLYSEKFDDRQKSRFFLRPGFTSLPAIKGRYTLSWEEQLEWDAIYVENISFLLDLKIILLTAWIVLRRKGLDNTECLRKGF